MGAAGMGMGEGERDNALSSPRAVDDGTEEGVGETSRADIVLRVVIE